MTPTPSPTPPNHSDEASDVVGLDCFEMWVVYRPAWGVPENPIACFALENLAKEFIESAPHRKNDFIKLKKMVIK